MSRKKQRIVCGKSNGITWSESVQFFCHRPNPRNKKQWVVGSVVPKGNGTYLGAILESSSNDPKEVFGDHSHRLVCVDVSLLQAILDVQLAVENHKFSKLKSCDCKEIK